MPRHKELLGGGGERNLHCVHPRCDFWRYVDRGFRGASSVSASSSGIRASPVRGGCGLGEDHASRACLGLGMLVGRRPVGVWAGAAGRARLHWGATCKGSGVRMGCPLWTAAISRLQRYVRHLNP